jgi:hypothetical protein
MARKKSARTSLSPVSTNKTPFPKGLAQPALRALASAGYDHLEQLCDVAEASLLILHGFGPNALRKIGDAMSEIGLSVAASGTFDSIPNNFTDLWCDDRERQGKAYQEILTLTEQPVAWACDVWDEVLRQLKDKHNRNRSIAAQVLCNLAKSDPRHRILKDFPVLFDVVADERFVTARHAMQSMWKVGCVGKKHQDMVVTALEKRFTDCVTHKNCTLIRYDIIECLRKLDDATMTKDIQQRAEALIQLESDPKYKKKYSTLWPKK